MKMVLSRTYTLATTKGHRIHFKKDEAVEVPQVCVVDAVGIGARPADGSDVDVVGEEVRTNDGPKDPNTREKEILAAIELLISQNARTDFTAAGLPSTDALKRSLGFDVGSAERNRAWQVYSNAKAEAEAA